MAIPNDDIEMAPAKGSSRPSIENDSAHTTDSNTNSNSNSSNANSRSMKRSLSVSVPIDSSVLESIVSQVRDEYDSDQDSQQKRKSQICCFVCCDLVKACIIMNSLHILISLSHLVQSVADVPSIFGLDIRLYDWEYDDDTVPIEQNIKTLNTWAVVGYTKLAFGFVFAIVPIIGAWKLSKNLVLAGFVWNIIYMILSAAEQVWSGFVVVIPFAYTNLHLFLVLRSKSITRENYTSEKYCCCGKDSL